MYILQLDLSSWIQWWIPLKNLAPSIMSQDLSGTKARLCVCVGTDWQRKLNKPTYKQTNKDITFSEYIPQISQWVNGFTHTIEPELVPGTFFYLILFFFFNSPYYFQPEGKMIWRSFSSQHFWESNEITNSENTL